jgi:hypothetical protein
VRFAEDMARVELISVLVKDYQRIMYGAGRGL